MPHLSLRQLISPLHICLQIFLAVLLVSADEIDRIFNLWLALVPIIGIPALIICITWVVAIFRRLIHSQRPSLFSILFAPLIVWLPFIILLRAGINPDWIRFQINRGTYENEVELSKEVRPRYKSWNFGATGGVAVVNVSRYIIFDESDKVMLKSGQKEDGGTISVRKMSSHFYLFTVMYQ
jgi:hypothetical protein